MLYNSLNKRKQHYSWALQFIKNQTPEICLESVKQNGFALCLVKEQTPEICLTAVKENWLISRYFEEKTPEICLEDIKQDKDAIRFVPKEFVEVHSTWRIIYNWLS